MWSFFSRNDTFTFSTLQMLRTDQIITRFAFEPSVHPTRFFLQDGVCRVWELEASYDDTLEVRNIRIVIFCW